MKKALIIGGGIAGPVTAMALQRAGFEVAIYEAHEDRATGVGSFLNVASNGLAALRTLGVHEAVRAAGFPTPEMVMWNDRGKRLGDIANGLTLDDGTTSVTMMRSELHRVLGTEARTRGIRALHGKRLMAVDEHDRGVVAHFADGTSAEGHLLIGADGVRSRTRELIDPRSPEPSYTGLLSIGGISATSELAETPGAYHMVFGRRAFFGYSVPRRGEVYWFANLAAATEPSREELRTFTETDWKRRLLELYADDQGPARAIVAATDSIGAYPIHDLPRVPVWHRGRMVIVGDAAHATSPSAGQGASLAMEDALFLARSLRDHEHHEAAFRLYDEHRRPRVERVVRYSRRISNNKAPGAVGRFFRDLFMPVALQHLASAESHAWLYRYAVEW